MISDDRLEIAVGGLEEVPSDWMPAAAVRPLAFDDPAIVWLEHHGADHGFEPKRTIEDAVAGLCRAFKSGLIPDAMTDTRYYNVKTMQVRGLR